MENLKYLIAFGVILFCGGIALTVLTWPYALATTEVDEQYPIACGIILIAVFIGQLISIIVTSLFRGCLKEIKKQKIKHHYLLILAAIIYLIIWFSCGAGQLIVIVLMIIYTEANSDGGAKLYGATIIILTMIYMFASSVYHIIVFIWFYHRYNYQRYDMKEKPKDSKTDEK